MKATKAVVVLMGLLLMSNTLKAQTVKNYESIKGLTGKVVVTGINNQGTLLVGYVENGLSVQSIVVDLGSTTVVSVPQPVDRKGSMKINRINTGGQIVGSLEEQVSGRSFGVIGNFTGMRSFSWGCDSLTVAAINDFGDTAGNCEMNDGRTFAWFKPVQDRDTSRLKVGINPMVTDINNNDDVIGTSEDGKGRVRGFLIVKGVYSQINVAGADETRPMGMNNKGDIVGSYSLAGDTNRHGFMILGGKMTLLDVGVVTEFEDINDIRQVVGHGKQVGSMIEGSFLLTP
jgi:hypothetical protein